MNLQQKFVLGASALTPVYALNAPLLLYPALLLLLLLLLPLPNRVAFRSCYT